MKANFMWVFLDFLGLNSK